MLTLFDQLFLLALDEDKGSIIPFAKGTLAYGLAGAILAELILRGKVTSNEKRRLEVVDASPVGDEILDEVLAEINTAEKPRKLSYWISQLSTRPKKLRERVGERLAARNLLIHDEKRYYWNPNPDPNAPEPAPSKHDLKAPLRALVLSSAENNPAQISLLEIVAACGLLEMLFTRDELPMAAYRIHDHMVRAAMENPRLAVIEEVGQAVTESIEDETE